MGMGSSEKLLIMVGISLLVTLLVVGPALAIWENRRCLDFLSEAERAKVQQMAKAASAKHVGERSLEPVCLAVETLMTAACGGRIDVEGLEKLRTDSSTLRRMGCRRTDVANVAKPVTGPLVHLFEEMFAVVLEISKCSMFRLHSWGHSPVEQLSPVLGALPRRERAGIFKLLDQIHSKQQRGNEVTTSDQVYAVFNSMVSSAELRAVTNAARAKYGCAAEKIQQKITKHLQRGENECMDMFMDLTIKIPSKIVKNGCAAFCACNRCATRDAGRASSVELCDWGLLGLPIGVSWLCVTAPVAGIGLFARGALGVSLDLAKGVGQRAGTAIEHIKEHGKSTPEQKALAEAVKARLTNDILNKKAPAAEEGEGTSGQGHAPHEAGQQEASSSSSSSFAFPLQHKKKPDDNAAAKTGGGKHPQTR